MITIRKFKKQKINFLFPFSAHAFMRMQTFYHAFLICIRTVEYSDPSLLIEMDPKLVKKTITFLFHKNHVSLVDCWISSYNIDK
jgi:hypothetical protein